MMSSLIQTKPQPFSEHAAPGPLERETVMEPLLALLAYLEDVGYEGHDLFDGLNSRLIRNTPLYRNEWVRLGLIQFCKRSPVNLRPLLRVPKGFNPKGGALFMMGHLNLLRHTRHKTFETEARQLYQRLRHCRIHRTHGIGWGYNFDWQARAFYVPEGTPNLVTSVYVGRAMLDYGRQLDEPEALELAVQIGDFILGEMVKFENDRHLCFNYIPGKDAEVHNANLLGAAYLAEIFDLLPPDRQTTVSAQIMKATAFSLADIQPDGAWPYGTKPFHRWVDNFHTAYNIEALMGIRRHLETEALDGPLARVIDYYLAHLFTADGLPKYYNTKTYPVDIHVVAETIVLLKRLSRETLPYDQARAQVIERALAELIPQFQDHRGYFYHQKLSRGWNRIPYIRWGQAWMFFALSSCLKPQG